MCVAATETILLCLMADVDTNDGVLQSNRPSCAHCVVNGAKWKLILRRAYFGSTVSSIPQMQKPLCNTTDK